MGAFGAADSLLIPKVKDMGAWAVIACDQFTSEPEYWEEVRARVGDAPSSFRLILPEAELGPGAEQRVDVINTTMGRYLDEGLFQAHPNAYVYVERTLLSGAVRKGMVGVVDLEEYDYHPGATAAIRATEGTVASRIPPRMAVRQNAPLELSHVLLLCDDTERALIEPLGERTAQMQKLYDFDLMLGGGRIKGWLVQGEEAASFEARLRAYEASRSGGMLYAAGDGNHSLATAKECWEAVKRRDPGLSRHPARYAMVELVNLHDPALCFEPIHRLMRGVDAEEVLKGLEGLCAPGGYPVQWIAGSRRGKIYLNRGRGSLAVGILQRYLDEAFPDAEIDYIHGEDVLERLSDAPGTIGFQLPPIEKHSFFSWVMMEGILPRKTFSMGHAREKRYYLEARKIVL